MSRASFWWFLIIDILLIKIGLFSKCDKRKEIKLV